MKNIVLPLFFVVPLFVIAQPSIMRCGYDEINQYQSAQHVTYRQAVNTAFENARRWLQRRGVYSSDTLYRIPVVVHIVYHQPVENLPDSLVYNQIEVLNRDYRRQNADTVSLRPAFNGLGADAGIEFYLACIDPNGNPTTGITRTYTNKSSFGNLFGGQVDEVKFDSTGGKSGWDHSRYLNIWVCNTGGAVLGLAYPPMGAPNWPANAFPVDPRLQGVVVHYEVFGRNNPYATGQYAIADQGRTLVHEIGHYLGLRHIWGDGLLSIIGIPDCSVDDGIADTPNSGTNSQVEGCLPTKNTCNDGPEDLPDMWENYMDYSEERCQNIFTRGQIQLMRAMIATARSTLLQPLCADTILDTTSSTMLNHSSFLFQSIYLYPNPAEEQLYIESKYTAIVATRFFNEVGREVSSMCSLSSISTSHTLVFHTASLLPGVYFLEIIVADGTIYRKRFLKK